MALVDVDPRGLEETAATLTPGPHRPLCTDLRRVEDAGSLLTDAVAKVGPLHGLVHAAGIQQVAPARMLEPGIWRDIFAVNTESALALAKGFHSKRTYAGEHGAIVFISSVMGIVGTPGAIAYSMSKAALHGMTKSLALEFAARRIRVNCVAPSFVRTPLFAKTERLWTEEQRKAVEAQHPLGFGEPEDVANAVAFLLADTGRWITGTTLVVDGGYLAQ